MKRLSLLVILFALSKPAMAQVLWNELTQGDLSDDRFAPTPFVLSPGDNSLFGILEGFDGQTIDRDYFSITVPVGYQFSELWLDSYNSSDFAAFMGIQPGPIFPDDPATVQPEDLMGWTLFGPNFVGQDLMPQLAMNGYGFTPPLPAGIYTFWAQQIGAYTEWTGNFVVTEVPEPGSVFGLLLGLSLVVWRRAK